MKIVVEGIPMAKQSARFRIAKNKTGKDFIMSYQKKELKDNETNSRYDIKHQLPKDFIPYANIPLQLELTFVYPPLKSWTKAKMKQLENGEVIYKTTKPDNDNLQKNIADILNGLVYTDDALVSISVVKKIYGFTPRTEIVIKTL